MSHLVSRILLATLLVPLALAVDLIVFVIIDRRFNYSFTGGWISNGVTALCMIGYWLLLWRKLIRWTPRRIGQSLAALVPAVVVVCAIWLAIAKSSRDEVGIFSG